MFPGLRRLPDRYAVNSRVDLRGPEGICASSGTRLQQADFQTGSWLEVAWAMRDWKNFIAMGERAVPLPCEGVFEPLCAKALGEILRLPPRGRVEAERER